MTRSPRPLCLTIAGLDPSGGAGIIADVRTFCSLDCDAAAAVTSITFQNARGVFGAVHQTAETVREQVRPVIDGSGIAAIKTGMLPTSEVVSAIDWLITDNQLSNYILDPVIRATSGYDLIDDAALRSIIEHLFPLADLITPNVPEAERITGIAIETVDDVVAAAAIMRSMGARNVLIKGGHFDANTAAAKATDYLFLDDKLVTLEGDFIEARRARGTGCILSAAIAANLAWGTALPEAVATAKTFVTEAIRNAPAARD